MNATHTQQLQDKVAIVTGGSTGIGYAVARRFAREGAIVFITGRREAELEQAAALIGGNVQAVAGDITCTEDLDRLYATVEATRGRLDILVANSGIAEAATLADITADHFDRTFELNARGTLFTAQRAAAAMDGRGVIVLIGSIAGSIGTAGYGTYGATKAATRSFSRTWTNELAGSGIRVNTLSPGPIDTQMLAEASPEVRQLLIDKIPLGRFGLPDEVAAAALFLASDESSFIAGAEICVDGGMAQV